LGGLALSATAIPLAGCNAIFDLKEAEKRGPDGGSATASSGAGGPTAGRICNDHEYDQGLVLEGDFENDGWFDECWGSPNGCSITGFGNEPKLCQGKFYLQLEGGGPPRSTDHAAGYAVIGSLTKSPCIQWSVAARETNGINRRVWISFDTTQGPNEFRNLISGTNGFVVRGWDWIFHGGACKAAIPKIPESPMIRIWVDVGPPDSYVDLDAMKVESIACTPAIKDCPR
jgi:hypothetical protein